MAAAAGEGTAIQGGTEPGYADLMAATDDRDDPVTLAFAGVIALASLRPAPYDVPIAGLAGDALAALVCSRFPHLPSGLWLRDGIAAARFGRHDEFADLVELLRDAGTPDDATTTWLAYAVATAAMGGNHLWQDMGLPSREVLSMLLLARFPALARRNTGDMKWKKFFYRELCRRAGLLLCKAPSCGECVDYPKCFGPEA
jgi:nitrogen fixation protein NifQ